MIKQARIRKITPVALVLLACWIAFPKIYVHQLLDHHHAQVFFQAEKVFAAGGNVHDCNFDQYDKPVFFPAADFSPEAAPLPFSRLTISLPGQVQARMRFEPAHALRGPPLFS